MAKPKAKAKKARGNPVAMPMPATMNTIPAPKLMPTRIPLAQPDHPRVKGAKMLNNNMAQAMKGRK